MYLFFTVQIGRGYCFCVLCSYCLFFSRTRRLPKRCCGLCFLHVWMKLNKAKSKTKKSRPSPSWTWFCDLLATATQTLNKAKKTKSWMIRIPFEGKISFFLGGEGRKIKIQWKMGPKHSCESFGFFGFLIFAFISDVRCFWLFAIIVTDDSFRIQNPRQKTGVRPKQHWKRKQSLCRKSSAQTFLRNLWVFCFSTFFWFSCSFFGCFAILVAHGNIRIQKQKK